MTRFYQPGQGRRARGGSFDCSGEGDLLAIQRLQAYVADDEFVHHIRKC